MNCVRFKHGCVERDELMLLCDWRDELHCNAQSLVDDASASFKKN